MNQPQPPHSGNPYPAGAYQPPAGYELKKKKRKKWPFVLGAIALLFVIIAVSNGGNSGSTSTATDPAAPAAGANAPAAAEGITYEVTTANGKGTASVTYTSDKNFNQSQENGAKLPWKKTVDLGGGFFTGASLVAQAGQGVESISCKVSDGDRVISENTSTGQFAVVTCSGS
jgi:hypothetical protein